MTGDAGVVIATVSATSLDFGRTVIGLTETLAVILRNPNSQPVTIAFGPMSGAAANDYAPRIGGNAPPATRTLSGGQGITLELAFTPSASGVRNASYTLDLCNGGCTETITLAGEGALEAISCTPALLSIGFVNPTACATGEITCENTSDHDSTVVGWGFASGTSTEYTLSSNAPTPSILSPGDDIRLDVEYCPTAFGRDDATVAVTVIHPNPALSTKTVLATGEGGGPDISCAPASVDLGVTAVGQTASRGFACTNVGNVPLLISAIDFGAGAPATLDRTLTVNGGAANPPFTLAGGDSVDVQVQFTPTGAGMVLGTLEAVSNDRDSPLISTPVSGESIAATPNCVLSIGPSPLDFGGIAPGGVGRAWVVAENSGTDDCAVNAAGVTGGVFALADPNVSAVLAPLEAIAIEVWFAPAAEGDFTGALELQTSDPNQATASVVLEGTGLTNGLLMLPAHVAFGNAATGCSNTLTRRVVVSNLDTNAVTITGLSLEAGSSSAYTLTSTSGFVLAGGSSGEIEIGFRPGLAGNHLGRVRVETAGLPAYYVRLSGAGTADGMNTIEYAGSPGRVIDMLMVVDDSCSMTATQDALSAAIGVFIDEAIAAGADFQIGVTTTDPSPLAPFVAGGIRGGIVSAATPDARGVLATNVTVGINGDPVELPLFAATQAVTDPAVIAGVNAGFLRANGELEVVIVTDEPDQSPGTVAQYIASMQTRPGGLGGSLRVHSISAGLIACQSPPGAVPFINGQASPRLVEISNLTGGLHGSICSDDYPTMLRPIASTAFGGRGSVYRLHTRPSPDSVEVRVDGVLLPTMTGTITNWSVSYNTDAVVFAPSRAPAPTSDVSITYQAFCVSPTCGNLIIESGEQCDDGDSDDGDACPTTCYDAFCGDTHLRSNVEQCDDGNLLNGDGCDLTCIIEGCGNGRLDPGEQCDDGQGGNSNTTPDACRLDCREAYCGDGVADTGEPCDDGNLLQTDACLNGCIAARCGDGHVQAGVEQCDDSNQTNGDGCDTSCNYEILTTYTMPAATTTVTETMTANQTVTIELEVTATSYLYAEVFTTLATACNGYTELRLYQDDGTTLIGSDTFDGLGSCSKIDPTIDTWALLTPGTYYLTLRNQRTTTYTYYLVLHGLETDICGNGVTEAAANEECDDGNTDDTDFCTNACLLNIGDYTVSTTPNQTFTAAPGTALTFTSVDDGTATVNIGFDFEFAGLAITDATVGTNGLIGFDDPANVRIFTNTALPTIATPNGIIAWWWDDMIANGTATSTLSGVAPNRVRRFTFVNHQRYSAAQDTVSAEIRLYETTNVIEVHYGTTTAASTSFSASVGWESQGAYRGEEVLTCTPSCRGSDWPTDTIITYTPTP